MNPTNNIGGTKENGSRDARGHWKPPYPASYAPLFEWPVKPKVILKWFFGYSGLLWTFNILIFLFTCITVTFLQPAIENCKNLEISWIGLILARNFFIMVTLNGGLHLTYYIYKLDGKERKYNPSFQNESKRQFLFGKQALDNSFRCLVSGLPIWTAFEVLFIWLAANGRVPYLGFRGTPFWFIAWFFLILVIRETHFYFIHRLIQWGPLFKYVHSVYHLNPNPGPWSSLAMHPVEHFLYFSGVFIHFIIPSNPLNFFFHIQHLVIPPGPGHLGF